jgi:uncharacterized protein YndB with AHSA1/START domain
MNPSGTSDTIVVETTIEAPAQRVFDALVDPEARLRWWGGQGRFRATHMEHDLRPGGSWLMRFDSGGRQTSVRGEYRAIEPPHRLSFTWLPDWYEGATETLVHVELTERAGVTGVRITHSGLATERDRANQRGWPDILAWLKAYAER